MNRYFVKAHRSAVWRRPHVVGRLPDHYYEMQRRLERPRKPVHDVPARGQLLDYYIADPKTLRVARKPDVRIPVYLPEQADEGLWAGDGIVFGYKKPDKKLKQLLSMLYPKTWFPELHRVILYSEILDKYMRVIVTDTAIRAIEDAQGFDEYILGTQEQDLQSQLALDLKRKMLIALAKKDFYHNDPAKQAAIYEKYKEYAIPLEQAEWYGYALETAKLKQQMIEINSQRQEPLKEIYAKELVKRFQDPEERKKLMIDDTGVDTKTFASRMLDKLKGKGSEKSKH